MAKITITPAALGFDLQQSSDKNAARLQITLDTGRDSLTAPTTQLRMVVYDIDQYLESQKFFFEAEGAGADPNDFETDQSLPLFTGREKQLPAPQRFLRLPDALRNPKPDEGTGVLAVADLVFKRVEDGPELVAARLTGGGRWYVNEAVGSFNSVRPAAFSVDIVMFAKRDEGGTFGVGAPGRKVIGSFGMSKDDILTKLDTSRLIAIRLFKASGTSGVLQPGTIFISSLNPIENTVGKYNGPRSRAIRLDISEAQKALVKPGQGTPQSVQAGTTDDRRSPPDLTGLYELLLPGVQADASANLPPAAIWIAQAGKAFVGWYYPYEEIGFDTPDKDKAPLGKRVCIVSAKNPEFPNKTGFFWFLAEKGEDPSELINSVRYPDADKSVIVRQGALEVLSSTDEDTRIRCVFSTERWALNLSNDAQEEVDTAPPLLIEAVFNRVRTAARFPWTIVRQLEREQSVPDDAVEALIRNDIEPLPINFKLQVARKLNSPEMAGVIRRFSENPDDDEIVQAEFNQAGKIINDIVTGFPNDQYRREVLFEVSALTKLIFFTSPGGDRKTLEEWLRIITRAHIDLEIEEREQEEGEPLTDLEREQVLENASKSQGGVLVDIGSFPEGRFEYVFEFFNLAAELKVVVGGAVGVTELTLTKNSLDSSGNVLRRDYIRIFVGAFLGFGAGFSASVIAGTSTKGSGATPPSATVRTFQDLTVEDWGSFPLSLPFFSVGAVAPINLGVNTPVVDISLLNNSSVFCQVRVPGKNRPAVTLSFLVKNTGLWKFKAADVTQVMKKIEEGKLLDAKAQLFSISMSIGFLIPIAAAKGVVPPPKELPILPDQTKPIDVLADTPLVSFAKGSSIIEPEQLLDMDRRLAMYRHLFELPGWFWCVGFGSPEWEARKDQAAQKNKELSQNRAQAANDAVIAALGARGEGVIPLDNERVAPHGAGREPSLAEFEEGGGGLLDPYDPKSDPKVVKEQFDTEYQKWRRVDVVANGTLVVRVRGT